MEDSKRTANCGELSAKDQGQEVVLNGWVHRFRDHGGVLFIDLRDRYGITQAVIDQDSAEELRSKAAELKFEYCIANSSMSLRVDGGIIVEVNNTISLPSFSDWFNCDMILSSTSSHEVSSPLSSGVLNLASS